MISVYQRVRDRKGIRHKLIYIKKSYETDNYRFHHIDKIALSRNYKCFRSGNSTNIYNFSRSSRRHTFHIFVDYQNG